MISTDENALTKIPFLLPNEINEEMKFMIVTKSENKFSNYNKFNTLFSDGSGEFICCQTYTDDLFHDYNINDVVILKKFIVLLAVDDKGFLPLNKKGFKLDITTLSAIELSNNNDKKILDLVVETIETLANDTESVKLFKTVKGVVLNKTISHPNQKTMVKYELANESFNYGIHLVLWNNDNVLDDTHLYTFKFVTVDKYNGGWQLSFNHFTKFEKQKKISKINISNIFIHLSQNCEKSVLYSRYDMFYMHSKGYLIGKILDSKKKQENRYQIKICVTMDDRQKILFISTFDRSNLFPYIPYNEKDVDKKMISLIGTEKKFLIAVKKVNEKTFFNVLSIFNYLKKI